ncbi:aldehyde dehydrogenase [Methylobacterium dankookense]|uniref:(Z)-2-((N-methylformamido)methylene)-5-hydroxybutyrolactone dehydrogenase n=1 Tax=Methylobacterium dankookense TaxID=560405 RepID=A0A564G5I4_9HYPH|nr:aldehyde dehydrogenase [Methylobacterium dankookense]GJD56498.1 (Z)-2-((N-methylformamido)methylene)-5-hydroxybutyrolactone dehydrogenase [Methylobacterium dankookense]VUF15294.1 Betaine aldehyde dehydrogenase [Methylobacterium dankookense]
MALERFRNTVAGRACESATGRWFTTANPFDGRDWAELPRCGPEDAEAAIEAAHAAFTKGPWPALSATNRGKLLRRLGDLVARDAETLAALEVRDNGKLYAEMVGQLRYIPEWFHYYGGLADKIEGGVLPLDKPDLFTYTKREPLGVIVCITPWNSPLMLLTWKLAPALAAGNTVVIKPSEFTSCSTLALMDLVREAGFPDGVVNTVTGYGAEVGPALCEHRHVAKVAFTGGDATGAAVYAAAAKGIKHVTLELGGKSPNIVFADANLDHAVKGAISGIFAASGQTCIAGSRLLVQRSVYEEVSRRLVDFAAQAKLGNPMDAATQVGPITTQPQREKVLSYIEVARSEGARCLLGGGRPEAPELAQGWFVQPTIFGEVSNAMRIAQEEVFGPVLSIIPFEDEDHAVEIANDSLYGLAAGIWTTDLRRALRLPDRIRAGTVWVNTYRAVSVMAPFGGYKRSGIGRENGQSAIDEYLQTKSVWINLAEDVPNPFVMR